MKQKLNQSLEKKHRFPKFNFSVYGHLVDRYLFNFRVAPEIIEKHIPQVPWLQPRIINGYGVVSFCLLKLRGLTAWPLPSKIGFNSTSSAYRIAIMDKTGVRQEPSVYVLGRNTDLKIISRLGPTLFSGNMQLVSTSITHNPSEIEIQANFDDGRKLFGAKISNEKENLDSKLFDSVDDFVAFIKGGTSSYTPSIHENHFSRVDLVEDSNCYEPVNAKIEFSLLDSEWKGSKLVFDSAFHAGGGIYRLKYLGSIAAE